MYNGTIDFSSLADFDASVLEKTVSYLTQINEQIKIFSSLQSSIKTVQETLKALAPIFAKNAAEQIKVNAASAAGAVAAQADAAAKLTNVAVTEAVTKESLLNTSAKITETTATTAAAGAYKVLNTVMTTSAGILGLIVIAATAVIAAIVTLIDALNRGSIAFQAQKKEVEELASAQEELAQSALESADAFENSAARLEASGKVARDLVGEMKDVASATDDAADKNEKMAALCAKLNATMDGLNIAYDKENGVIRNVNTGQEVSLEQLDKLVKAKAELTIGALTTSTQLLNCIFTPMYTALTCVLTMRSARFDGVLRVGDAA